MRTIEDNGTLTPEAFSVLVKMADLPLPELRHRVYNFVPERMWQLQRWTRGQLIAKLFDGWLGEKFKDGR